LALDSQGRVSQGRVSHELIEFLINDFKGDDFVISVFVSECYLPILAKDYSLSNSSEVLISQSGDSLVLLVLLHLIDKGPIPADVVFNDELCQIITFADIDDPWPCGFVSSPILEPSLWCFDNTQIFERLSDASTF